MAASTQGFCDLSDKTRMRLGKIRIETMLRFFSYDLLLSLLILLDYRTCMTLYGVSKLLLVYSRLTKTQ
jgi:hypothetical protein